MRGGLLSSLGGGIFTNDYRMTRNRPQMRAFTLIELMIVVVIIGVLAALAIYGVSRYVAYAKTAEARMVVGRIAKDAVTSFEREDLGSTVLSFGGTAAITHELCGTATPVPGGAFAIGAPSVPPPQIAGRKYQPAPSEWATGDEDDGWICLGTAVTTATYFAYGYSSVSSDPAVAGDHFAAHAAGDLDGDAIGSSFWLEGRVQADSGGNLALVLATTVGEYKAEE